MAPRRYHLKKTRKSRRRPRRSKVYTSLTTRPSPQQIYKYARFATEVTFSEGAAETLIGQDFRLSNLINGTDFTNLYQEYKITKVEIFFNPRSNVQTNSIVQSSVSTVFVAYDPNDASAPSSINEMREMAGLKVITGFKPFKYTVYPKLAMAVYDGGVTNAYADAKPWLNTSYPTARYFGLKIGVSANNSAPAFYNSWSMNYRYTVCFRRMK